MKRITRLFFPALLLALALALPAAAQQKAPEAHGDMKHEHKAEAATHEIAQQKCPVMGLKPVPQYYADYKGKRIYFCCSACPDMFKKDPEKYWKKLQDEGIKLEDAPK